MTLRVSLRPVEPADLPLFFEHQRDPDAVRMAAFPARDRAAFDAHWAKVLADPTNLTRTLVCDGRVAGYVCRWLHDGIREVGYWIAPEFWGKGVATAGLRLLLVAERARPLYAHVAVANLGSVRVLEKCGFTRLRTERGSPGPGVPEVEEHLYVIGAPATPDP